MLGAICGDILGSGYEYEEKKYDTPESIELCREYDTFTDDTAMTLAVADWLLNDIERCYYEDDKLKEALGRQFLEYAKHTFKDDEGNLGFGSSFCTWCAKADLIGDYSPYGSYGNGSGMRVSPVGWFFDTMEETMRFAKISADVTHDHPEGEKGAMCIAAAIFLARKGKTKEEIKDYLIRAFGYDLLDKPLAKIRRECSWSEICQDTVPMAVVAFLESFDYESAVKNAISYGSDSDTIADMAGAIAEAFYYKHIRRRIKDFCLSKIPPKQIRLIEDFYSRCEWRSRGIPDIEVFWEAEYWSKHKSKDDRGND